jgi:hypothetical protein
MPVSHKAVVARDFFPELIHLEPALRLEACIDLGWKIRQPALILPLPTHVLLSLPSHPGGCSVTARSLFDYDVTQVITSGRHIVRVCKASPDKN